MSYFQSSGRWYWNDNLNELEFTSTVPASDRQEKKQKEKRTLKESKGRNQKAKPKKASRSSPIRQLIKVTPDHTTVTVQDVKEVARVMLSDAQPISPAFDKIFESAKLDEFLALLINYFHWFFEREKREKNPNPIHIEMSVGEKKNLAEIKTKLGNTQKHLGRAYGALLLGTGFCSEHHMGCGKYRVSNTYKDRSLFETFYSFCTFVIWIAFRRKLHDVINKEVNRLLRSDTFNPALRVKFSDPTGGEEAEANVSPTEQRRNLGSRPPIKDIMNQRSAALVSILPLPKEESEWLFKRTKARFPTAPKEVEEELTEEQLQADLKRLTVEIKNEKVGIIGEPLDEFNLTNLMPLEEKEEKEIPTQTKEMFTSVDFVISQTEVSRKGTEGQVEPQSSNTAEETNEVTANEPEVQVEPTSSDTAEETNE